MEEEEEAGTTRAGGEEQKGKEETMAKSTSSIWPALGSSLVDLDKSLNNAISCFVLLIIHCETVRHSLHSTGAAMCAVYIAKLYFCKCMVYCCCGQFCICTSCACVYK